MSDCEFGKELKDSLRRELDEMRSLHKADITDVKQDVKGIYDRLWKIMVGIAATCALQLLSLIIWSIFKK